MAEQTTGTTPTPSPTKSPIPAGPSPLLQFFTYTHLPPDLQEVSKPFCELAANLETRFASTAEKTAGLRKLLEAKDCFVRCLVEEKARKQEEARKKGNQPTRDTNQTV